MSAYLQATIYSEAAPLPPAARPELHDNWHSAASCALSFLLFGVGLCLCVAALLSCFGVNVGDGLTGVDIFLLLAILFFFSPQEIPETW